MWRHLLKANLLLLVQSNVLYAQNDLKTYLNNLKQRNYSQYIQFYLAILASYFETKNALVLFKLHPRERIYSNIQNETRFIISLFEDLKKIDPSQSDQKQFQDLFKHLLLEVCIFEILKFQQFSVRQFAKILGLMSILECQKPFLLVFSWI